mmetsp:Transcript_45121/g.107294  ORF Transcript_45121/g.107294 Transcript_45121/m.107294 type:complete len:588 (+) Transcript_45121:131-1894(+)
MAVTCTVFLSALVQASWAVVPIRATDLPTSPSTAYDAGGPGDLCHISAPDGEVRYESWEVHVGLLQTDVALSRNQRAEHVQPGADDLVDHWLDELFEAEPEAHHFLVTTLRLLGIVAVGYAAMAAAHAWVWSTSPSEAARTKWQLQVEVYCDSFINGMTTTSMAPLALPISQSLGHGEQFSGLMMSSFAMVTILGSGLGSFLAPRLSPYSKRYVIAFSISCGVLALTIQGLITQGVLVFATVPRRDIIFVAARVFQGFVYFTWVTLFFTVATEVCQPALRVRQQLYLNLALMLGSGSGPLVVSILASSSENTAAASYGLAAPMYASAALLAFHAVACWMVVPSTVEAVDAAAADDCGMELVASTPHVERCLPADLPCDERSLFLRKLLYCFGNLYGVERAVVTMALESATSLVLESHFGWSTSRIGIWIGGVYLLGTLVAFPLSLLKDNIGELLLMKIGSSLGVLASLLLAFFIFKAEFVVLLADFVLFSACFVGSGIAEGFALAAAIPDSPWFNVGNYWAFSNILKHNVGRFAAPLVVRSTIMHSTTLYGVAQVSLTSIGFVLCHAAAYTVKELQSQSTRQADLKG